MRCLGFKSALKDSDSPRSIVISPAGKRTIGFHDRTERLIEGEGVVKAVAETVGMYRNIRPQ